MVVESAVPVETELVVMNQMKPSTDVSPSKEAELIEQMIKPGGDKNLTYESEGPMPETVSDDDANNDESVQMVMMGEPDQSEFQGQMLEKIHVKTEDV